MSDDDDGTNVLHLPTRGGNSGPVPRAPDAGSLFYTPAPDTPEPDADDEPEQDSGTRGGVHIPALRDPASFLSEPGIAPTPDVSGEEEESEYEGEYEYPRTLADRLGDWLELRLDIRRARLDAESPYREAEIARKVALLESQTAAETGMMEAQNKLRQAHLKARTDKAGARAGASSGFGADKGRGGSGGGRGGGLGGGRGGGRGPGGGSSGGGKGPGSGSGRGGSGAGLGGGRNTPSRSNSGSGKPTSTDKPRTQTPSKASGGGSGGRSGGGATKGPQSGSRGSQGGSGGSPKNRNDGPTKNRSNGGGSGGNQRPAPHRTLDPHKPGNRPWRNNGATNNGGGGGGVAKKLPGSGGAVSPWKNKPTNNPTPHKPTPKPSPTPGPKQPGQGPSGGTSGAGPVNNRPKLPPHRTIDPHKPGNRPWKNNPSTSAGAAKNLPGSGGAIGPWKNKPTNNPTPNKPNPNKPPLNTPAAHKPTTPGSKQPGQGGTGWSWKTPPATPTPVNPKPSAAGPKPGTVQPPPMPKHPPTAGGGPGARPKVNFTKKTGSRAADEARAREEDRLEERFTTWWTNNSTALLNLWRDWTDEAIDAHLNQLLKNTDFDRGSFRHRIKTSFRDYLAARRDARKRAGRAQQEREQHEADAASRIPVPPEDLGISTEFGIPRANSASPPPPEPEPSASAALPRSSDREAPDGSEGDEPAPETPVRPGTTRPGLSKEESVADTQVAPAGSGQGGLAAKHQTDITFGEYLIEMASIAVTAAMDGERSEALTQVMTQVAETLEEMAADLADDHNVDREITDMLSGLADQAGDMKQIAQRCAAECADAAEAAKLAGQRVARVYGEDMAAKQDGGLTHASAAAHHA
ncbi:hypothetical protein [Streptomyces sp. SGAir0957]